MVTTVGYVHEKVLIHATELCLQPLLVDCERSILLLASHGCAAVAISSCPAAAFLTLPAIYTSHADAASACHPIS